VLAGSFDATRIRVRRAWSRVETGGGGVEASKASQIWTGRERTYLSHHHRKRLHRPLAREDQPAIPRVSIPKIHAIIAFRQESAQLLQVRRVERVFEDGHELRREAAVTREVFFVVVLGRRFGFQEEDGDGFGGWW